MFLEPNVCLFVNWFKKIYWRFLSNGFKKVIGTPAKNLTYAMNLKASFNVHQTKKAFGKDTFAYGFKRHKARGGDSHMKVTGMLVVSLRVVNCRFWSHLGC